MKSKPNKYQVARAVAKRLPDLAAKLPRKRKIWEKEHYRMRIFDAAAVGVAYLMRRRSVKLHMPENETSALSAPERGTQSARKSSDREKS